MQNISKTQQRIYDIVSFENLSQESAIECDLYGTKAITIKTHTNDSLHSLSLLVKHYDLSIFLDDQKGVLIA